LLADADADLVGTVGDHAAANLLHAAEHTADRPRQFRQLAEVPVSARHRDHCSRGIDTGPREQPRVDSGLQSEYGTANVADGGEAAHQCVGRLNAGRNIVVSDITDYRLGENQVDRDPYWRDGN
jgi:hypothetical protein